MTTIHYKPGKEMLLADTLSRTYLEDCERSATEVEVECIHATHFLPIPDRQLKELQRETACDSTFQALKKAILDGFPDTKDELPSIHTLMSGTSSQYMMASYSRVYNASYCLP